MKSLFSLLALTSTALLPILIDSAVKGIGLLALAFIAAILIRRSSASTRHIVWVTTLVALLILPLLSLTLPKWRILPDWIQTQEVSIATKKTVDQSLVVFDTFFVEQNETDSTTATSTPSLPENNEQWNNWQIAVIVWLLGVSLLSLRLVAGMIRLRFLGKRHRQSSKKISTLAQGLAQDLGIQRKIRVQLGAEQSMPMTWGVFRPLIQLPAEASQWNTTKLQTVLLHELAHVKRHDILTQLLVQFSCAIHWFNPFVWIAAQRIELDRERACDDIVLAHGVQASDYATDLMEIVTQTRVETIPHTGLAMARLSALENRLKAILNQRLNRRGLNRSMCAILAITSLIVVLPLAMLDAAKADEPDEAQLDQVDPSTSEAVEKNQLSKEQKIKDDALKQAGLTPIKANFTDLNTAIASLELTKHQADKSLQQLKQLHGPNHPRVVQATQLQQEIQQLRTFYGAKHPKVVQTTKQLNEAVARAAITNQQKELRTNKVAVHQLQQKIQQLRTAYGAKHPRIVQATTELKQLTDEVALKEVIETQLKSLSHPQLSKHYQKLTTLRKIYTDKHPEVLKVLKEIQVIETEIEQQRLQQKSREMGVPLSLLKTMSHPEKWAGIGISFSLAPDGHPKVEQIVKGGAAEKNGNLKSGDLILSIHEEHAKQTVSLQHLKHEAILKAIRGAEGSTIILTTRRDDKKFKLKLKRALLPNKPASLKDSSSANPMIGHLFEQKLDSSNLATADKQAEQRRKYYEEAFLRASEIERMRAKYAKTDLSQESTRMIPLKFVKAQEMLPLITALRAKNVTTKVDGPKVITLTGPMVIVESLEKIVKNLDQPAPKKLSTEKYLGASDSSKATNQKAPLHIVLGSTTGGLVSIMKIGENTYTLGDLPDYLKSLKPLPTEAVIESYNSTPATQLVKLITILEKAGIPQFRFKLIK